METPSSRTGVLLTRLVGGDAKSADDLFPLAYEQLHALAERLMRGERGDHTLHPTALVHEAYVRLVDMDQFDWRGEAQFGMVASRAMRRILVDHARKRRAEKRGGGAAWDRVTLGGVANDSAINLDVLSLDEALSAFERKFERQAKTVELRFFGGQSRKEIAEVLQVSERTVTNDLAFAQAWLLQEIEGESGTAAEPE